jgi:hypothetical protein
LRAKDAIRYFTLPSARLAFNWWVPDNFGTLDWGPQQFPGRASFFGGRGQPMGDRMKYFYLSNQEIDYDQVQAAIDYFNPFEPVWLPPPASQTSAFDIADGVDSRFLLSAGPFDIGPGNSVPFTVAVFIGPRFHFDPVNFQMNFSDRTHFLIPLWIDAYKTKLDLRGLIENSRMARKVFDNENVQSPVFCQTTLEGPVFDWDRVHGDGIPDFRGPIPPPYPKVELTTGEGEVTLRWFGEETEHTVDPISGLKDFEGYTVQMSPDGVNYTVVGYYEKVNWRVHYLNWDVNQNGHTDNDPMDPNDDTVDIRWEPTRNRALTYDEIQNYFALRWDTCMNHHGDIKRPINPEKYSASIRFWGRPPLALPATPFPDPWCNPDTIRSAIRVRSCDRCGSFGLRVDTIFYFVPEGYNNGLDQARMYPSVTDPDNDSAYWYQFKMTGLFPSQPMYFAVAPFDHGMVTLDQRIEPQSASPFGNAYLVYPIATDSARREEGLRISVYPNPYRIDHDYSFFEKKHPITGHPQSNQRINFVNLPPKCTIRIYTVDGDLVQQINHDKDPNASDSGYDFWDLLTRNAQKVVAGLYVFTVESNEGRSIGKLIIIQ